MTVISGKIFVVGDNIDTDQIIPAHYLNLVPTIPAELEKLGSHALSGLPDHYGKFVAAGQVKSPYTIIIGGRNFGCGSSREHAPVCLGAAGGRAVVAESFARIFFRNSIATGQLYPMETPARLCEKLQTGDEAELDLKQHTLTLKRTGEVFPLRDPGAAKEVIAGGGLFEYARTQGLIKKQG